MSTAGRMTLNAELLELPKDIGEFVIVHELVHLLAPNHGKLFKLFMSAYMPDWTAREKDLRARERKKLLAQQRAQKQKENKAKKDLI
jgi:predicted metal-dependent hydrolase